MLIGRNEQATVECELQIRTQKNGGSVHGFKDENVRKTLDFTGKINRLQDVTIEISYVNMCGALSMERRIFATLLAVLPKLLRVYEFPLFY